MYHRKTKIVATIGPATESEEMLTTLIKTGLNVVRLNFSHGNHEEHEAKLLNARKAALKLDMPIAILQDLSGPKIRIGEFYQERVQLTAGEEFILTTEQVVGDEHKAYVNYPKLPAEVKVGGTIFLDDGKKKLTIEKIEGSEIHCRIISGGETKGRRGVNVPGAYLSLSSLTDKDREDLKFGLKHDVDYMAISFVRQASDVEELRKILEDNKMGHIKIIAKIETEEAIENIDAIIEVSDSIMVARGDLAIEVPTEQVPVLQKMIIAKCNKVGKSVITATQMLESMINSPVPTRAEVSDIANAIFDGTDAIMLSEETTLGKYPVEAVEVMNRVAAFTEGHYAHDEHLIQEHLSPKTVTDAISYSAMLLSHDTDATAIIALSESGFTARMIARHRPHKPVIVLTPHEKVRNQLTLSFGCYPMVAARFDNILKIIASAKETLLEKKLVTKGDKVIIVAGVPLAEAGTTNTVMVQEI